MSEIMTFNNYTFQVQGMHCIKCIRTIQAVGDKFSAIRDIEIDLGSQLVKTQAYKNFSVEDFMNEIKKSGFGISDPRKIEDNIKVDKNTKEALKRIGIAGACAGNIMILSAAEYAGAELGEWPGIFQFFSLLFFIPVFFYSGWPLYQNAWFQFKSRNISIDTPIVMAIVGGAVLSFYNFIFSVQAQVYFDSISMFIFFLISSRYIVLKIQSQYTKAVSTEDVFNQVRALRVKGDKTESVDAKNIKVNDLISIPRDSYVGFDGELVSNSAYISDAFYSGEAYPQKKNNLDLIYAGSKNVGESFHLRVKKTEDETRLSKIIKMLNSSIKSSTYLSKIADKGASLLTFVIVATSLIILIYFSFASFNFEEGVNRVLALLVVACPCGLAIATPLVQTLAVKKALKESLLVKDVSVFESFDKVDAVFFDKTGTLTKGDISVVSCNPRLPTELEKIIIFNLEIKSEHPISRAIKFYTGYQEEIHLENYKEEKGKGVSADYNKTSYFLGASDDKENNLVFKVNSEPVLYMSIQDELSINAQKTISYFKSKNISPYILSGDKKEETLKVADAVGVRKENVFFQKSPFEKSEIIKNYEGQVMYFGDGINDSLAMSNSLISVSMRSSADIAFKSSKIHILEGGLFRISKLIDLSRVAYRSMKIIIFISLVYNIIFAILASFGFIKPLIAVVIMPISSISITCLGLYLMNTFKTKEGC